MADNVGVVEDGVATEPPKRRSNPGWMLAATGFVMGLGLGILIVNPSPQTEVPPVTDGLSGGIAPPTTVTSTPEDLGISASVPDFPDTFVAVARTTGSTMDHLLWPLRGELRVRSMASGSDVRLDSVASFIAFSEVVPGSEGVLLSSGRFHQINPVANDVTSYVWHDSASGDLAYTTQSDGVWRLYVIRSSFSPRLVAESTVLGARLVGFGDWGWAIQTSPDELSLLTPEGVFKDTEAGVGYASHRDGWIFMMDDRPKLVSSGGGVVRIDADLDLGTLSMAAFSPDRARVAVAGERGWGVLDVASGEVESIGRPTASLAWSSDSRFALSAWAAGVDVYDTETETRYFLLRGRVIHAIGTAPLSNS